MTKRSRLRANPVVTSPATPTPARSAKRWGPHYTGQGHRLDIRDHLLRTSPLPAIHASFQVQRPQPYPGGGLNQAQCVGFHTPSRGAVGVPQLRVVEDVAASAGAATAVCPINPYPAAATAGHPRAHPHLLTIRIHVRARVGCGRSGRLKHAGRLQKTGADTDRVSVATNHRRRRLLTIASGRRAR